MSKNINKTDDPKNNDNIYNLKEYTIKLDTGYIYYLLGFLIGHKDKAIIVDLYYEILEQVVRQNKSS